MLREVPLEEGLGVEHAVFLAAELDSRGDTLGVHAHGVPTADRETVVHAAGGIDEVVAPELPLVEIGHPDSPWFNVVQGLDTIVRQVVQVQDVHARAADDAVFEPPLLLLLLHEFVHLLDGVVLAQHVSQGHVVVEPRVPVAFELQELVVQNLIHDALVFHFHSHRLGHLHFLGVDAACGFVVAHVCRLVQIVCVHEHVARKR
mmetsp:Transcript_23795/g.70105  ORF Transcript_23795/g.70105 Transcript_23795/m.70105 type:complete len:203 (+) Transcript_23795:424-1032(+)